MIRWLEEMYLHNEKYWNFLTSRVPFVPLPCLKHYFLGRRCPNSQWQWPNTLWCYTSQQFPRQGTFWFLILHHSDIFLFHDLWQKILSSFWSLYGASIPDFNYMSSVVGVPAVAGLPTVAGLLTLQMSLLLLVTLSCRWETLMLASLLAFQKIKTFVLKQKPRWSLKIFNKICENLRNFGFCLQN